MVGGGRAGGGYQEIQEQEQEVRAHAGGAISTAASKASPKQLLTVQMHKPHSPMQPLPSPGLISNAVWKLGKQVFHT